MTRILVIDGYDADGMKGLADAEATKAGDLYKAMLAGFMLADDIDVIDISLPAPAAVDVSKYDGVCWTGSNLFFSEADAIVQRHIDLCQSLFEKGIPQFGSCWAAQLAAAATGGTVKSNSWGREFGMARKIGLTDAGKAHPMYAGKPHIFEGFTSHGDIIDQMPPGGTLLATNRFGGVQALEVKHGAGEFWAVQYHPEYDFAEIAGLTIARKDSLINQGTFKDEAAVTSYVQDMRDLEADKARFDISWKYGIEPDLSDEALRRVEVKNWLNHFFKI